MDTKVLKNEISAIEEAAEIIRRGGLLGIPTETVYGLGANALDEDAVKHIFEAKGRPQDNPLIIHVPGKDWLSRYCVDVPEIAYQLADEFWPGPLTMILKRNPIVPLRTTGGLETVGVRCPNHPLTLQVIEKADVPIAAPSGNTSGRPSPTSCEHMLEDMNGKIDAIIDGGPCQVGVESTIIDLSVTPPRLLRPGGLPLEDLERVIGEVQIDKAVREKLQDGEVAKAPGMKYRHYAPKAPVIVVTGSPMRSAGYILQNATPKSGIICFDEFKPLFQGNAVETLGSVNSKLQQAQHVFAALRNFDTTDVENIFAQCPEETGLGLAIANRLKKAAGFQTVDAGRPVIIGITGPTGAGKSSALKAIEKMGGMVLDCDAIYHELLDSSEGLIAAIQKEFPQAFDEEKLNRKTLGEIVFHDADKLKLLSTVIDPFICDEVERRIHASVAPVIGIDAINLLSSGIKNLCQRTLGILCPKEIRLQRIMKRDGIDEAHALARIDAQPKDEYYKENCADILENKNDNPEQFQELAFAYISMICKEAQS